MVLPEARYIARLVTMLELLTHLGWRIHRRGRADCGLCRGNSNGTVSYKERLWHCHRCDQGGDVFSLVRRMKQCDFPTALRFVADLAGIRLEGCWKGNFQDALDAQKRQRERAADGGKKLSALEHRLLRECRDRIHAAERNRLRVSARLEELSRGEPERFRGEQEGLWLTLKAALVLLNTDIPAYTLLSFAPPAERARFVLHPEERDEMIDAVRWSGYVRTEDSKLVEVLQ